MKRMIVGVLAGAAVALAFASEADTKIATKRYMPTKIEWIAMEFQARHHVHGPPLGVNFAPSGRDTLLCFFRYGDVVHEATVKHMREYIQSLVKQERLPWLKLRFVEQSGAPGLEGR